MFGLLKSVSELACSVVDIVAAPVEVAADLANAALKPVAEVVKDLASDIKSIKD